MSPIKQSVYLRANALTASRFFLRQTVLGSGQQSNRGTVELSFVFRGVALTVTIY